MTGKPKYFVFLQRQTPIVFRLGKYFNAGSLNEKYICFCLDFFVLLKIWQNCKNVFFSGYCLFSYKVQCYNSFEDRLLTLKYSTIISVYTYCCRCIRVKPSPPLTHSEKGFIIDYISELDERTYFVETQHRKGNSMIGL
jgi:hypothetical protein